MIGALKPVRAVATVGGLLGLWKLNNHKNYLKDESRTLAKKYCDDYVAPDGILTPDQMKIVETMARFKEQESTANYIESNPVMESLVNPILDRVESVTVPVAEAVSATLGFPSAVISGYVLPALLLSYCTFVGFLIYRQFKMQSIILNGSSYSSTTNGNVPVSSQSQPVFHIHNHPSSNNPYNLPHNRSDFLTTALIVGVMSTILSGFFLGRSSMAIFPSKRVALDKVEVTQSLEVTRINQEHLLDVYKNSDMLIQQANNTNKFMLFIMAVGLVVLVKIAYDQHKLTSYKPIQVVSSPTTTPLQLPSNTPMVEPELAYIRKLMNQENQMKSLFYIIDPVSMIIIKSVKLSVDYFKLNRIKPEKHTQLIIQDIVDNPCLYPVLKSDFGFTAFFLAVKSAFPYLAGVTTLTLGGLLGKEYWNWFKAADTMLQGQRDVLKQAVENQAKNSVMFSDTRLAVIEIQNYLLSLVNGTSTQFDEQKKRFKAIEDRLKAIEDRLDDFARRMRARADEFFGWNKRKSEDDDKPEGSSAASTFSSPSSNNTEVSLGSLGGRSVGTHSAGRSPESDSDSDDEVPLLDSRFYSMEGGALLTNQRGPRTHIQGPASAGQAPSPPVEELEVSYEQNATTIPGTSLGADESDFSIRSLALPAVSRSFEIATGFSVSDISQTYQVVRSILPSIAFYSLFYGHSPNQQTFSAANQASLANGFTANEGQRLSGFSTFAQREEDHSEIYHEIVSDTTAVTIETDLKAPVVEDSFTRRLLMGSFTSKAISYGSFAIGGPVLSLATKSALHYIAFGQAPAWMPAITGSVNKLVRSQTDPTLKDYSFGSAFKEVRDGFSAPLPGSNMVTFKGGDQSDIDD